MEETVSHSFLVAGKRNGKTFRIQLRKLGTEKQLPEITIFEHENLGNVFLLCFRYSISGPTFSGNVDLYNFFAKRKTSGVKHFYPENNNQEKIAQIAFTENNVLLKNVREELSKSVSITGFKTKIAGQKMSSGKRGLLTNFFEYLNGFVAAENYQKENEQCEKPMVQLTDELFLRRLRVVTGLEVFQWTRPKTAGDIQREKRKKYGYAKH